MAIDIIQGLTDIGLGGVPNSPSPGAFDIRKCEIQHGDDAIYDITPLVAEIHFFEDIEQLGITGWLKIRDSINLIRNGLIIGEELLWLDFETAGATEAGHPEWQIHGDPLYIHKIEAIESPIGNQGNTTQSWLEYRLHFCSTEMITNDRMRISKTVQGTIGSVKGGGGHDGIVYDIIRNDLGVNKYIYCANTYGIRHFVTPNMHPFDLITFLVNSAHSFTGKNIESPQPGKSSNMFKNQHADMVIYETAQREKPEDGGWFFVPLQREETGASTLQITLNNSMTTSGGDSFAPTAAAGQLRGYPAAMLRSKSFEYIITGDKWKTIRSGCWGATQIRHNSVSKSFDRYTSDYLKQLRKDTYSHASETPVFFDSGSGTKLISEWPNANVGYYSFSKGDMTSINKSTWRADTPYDVGEPDHGIMRKMQMSHMLGYERIQCEMWGNSALQIGRNAITEFPQIGAASGNPRDTGITDSWDRYGEDRNNNLWMITKVAHHIIRTGNDPIYTTTVELANTMRATTKKLPIYGSLVGSSKVPAALPKGESEFIWT
jgi:hypothetical protein